MCALPGCRCAHRFNSEPGNGADYDPTCFSRRDRCTFERGRDGAIPQRPNDAAGAYGPDNTRSSAPSQLGPSTHFMPSLPATGATVTDYYKQNVNDPTDNKVGEVLDLIIDKDGRIIDALVRVGGFLGIDEKNLAISSRCARPHRGMLWR